MNMEEKDNGVIKITKEQFNKMVEVLTFLREKFPNESEFKLKLGDVLFMDNPDNPRFFRLCYVNDFQVNVGNE